MFKPENHVKKFEKAYKSPPPAGFAAATGAGAAAGPSSMPSRSPMRFGAAAAGF